MGKESCLFNTTISFSYFVSIQSAIYFKLWIVQKLNFFIFFRIFFIKRLVAWYFQRRVNKNSSQLQTLRTQKKQLLEQVMDKETYKVALEILNKFSEKPIMRPNQQQATMDGTPRSSLTPRIPQQQQGLVRRNIPQTQQLTPGGPSISSQSPLSTPYGFRSPLQQQQQQLYSVSRQIAPQTPQQLNRPRTAYPVIDQRSRGILEKFVDYLVGDGPANRFAMICKECLSHNGMALQEEYEYAAFKCAFCNALNPSRKQRPVAPRLEGTPERRITERRLSSSTSEEEKISGSDTESDHDDKQDKNVIGETNKQEETIENLKENKNVETTNTESVNELPKSEPEKKDD